MPTDFLILGLRLRNFIFSRHFQEKQQKIVRFLLLVLDIIGHILIFSKVDRSTPPPRSYFVVLEKNLARAPLPTLGALRCRHRKKTKSNPKKNFASTSPSLGIFSIIPQPLVSQSQLTI